MVVPNAFRLGASLHTHIERKRHSTTQYSTELKKVAAADRIGKRDLETLYGVQVQGGSNKSGQL